MSLIRRVNFYVLHVCKYRAHWATLEVFLFLGEAGKLWIWSLVGDKSAVVYHSILARATDASAIVAIKKCAPIPPLALLVPGIVPFDVMRAFLD